MRKNEVKADGKTVYAYREGQYGGYSRVVLLSDTRYTVGRRDRWARPDAEEKAYRVAGPYDRATGFGTTVGYPAVGEHVRVRDRADALDGTMDGFLAVTYERLAGTGYTLVDLRNVHGVYDEVVAAEARDKRDAAARERERQRERAGRQERRTDVVARLRSALGESSADEYDHLGPIGRNHIDPLTHVALTMGQAEALLAMAGRSETG